MWVYPLTDALFVDSKVIALLQKHHQEVRLIDLEANYKVTVVTLAVGNFLFVVALRLYQNNLMVFSMHISLSYFMIRLLNKDLRIF